MAKSNSCSVCVKATAEKVDVNTSHSKVFWAELLDVSEASVRRHFKHVAQGKTLNMGGSVPGMSGTDTASRSAVVEESTDGSKSVTAIRDRPVTLDDARQWIESSGDDPEAYHIAIKSIAYGADLFSNKMSAWPKIKRNALGVPVTEEDKLPEIDPVALLKELRTAPVYYGEEPKRGTGESAFVLSINDTQFGKVEGGGTPETLARIDNCIYLAQERIEELRESGRDLGTLVIIGGGDIIEGCTIYGNQSFNLDLNRRGQINTAVTMILDVLDRLAPLFEKVIVLAARGNHGENRINGHRTTLDDNDDVLVFEMAKNATQRDPNLSHVEYIIAFDEAGVYTDVAGWRLGTTHGDVYGKGGAGASIDKKAQNWYKNMSMAREGIGMSDVLITHHYHHDKMSDWGACLWRQTPALDGGSEWFRQSTGESSESGMLTFVMSEASRYSDEAVLR
jgi:hypothetical protein